MPNNIKLENPIHPVSLTLAQDANLVFIDLKTFIWKGTWATSPATYNYYDVVFYNGSSYVNVTAVNTSTNPASDTTNWKLMASKGDTGPAGSTGSTGAAGSAATVSVGSTTTGSAGSSATVTNSGTTSAAVFNFTIPRGETGAAGAAGSQGPSGVVNVTSPITNSGSSTNATIGITTGSGGVALQSSLDSHTGATTGIHGAVSTNTPSTIVARNSSGNFSANQITISGTPTDAADVVTKAYADAISAGMNWHESCEYGTTTVLPNSPTYTDGTADASNGLGIGAYLEAGSNALLSIDGNTTWTAGDRVLVKDQANAKQNGIYTVSSAGADDPSGSKWKLIRATDTNNSVAGQVKAGDSVFVAHGTVNVNQGFIETAVGSNGDKSIKINGTTGDNIVFTQFTGTSTLVAGLGLTKSGNTIDVGTASASNIVINADNIDLATVSRSDTGSVTTTNFVKSVTSDTYGRLTGVTLSTVPGITIGNTGVALGDTMTTIAGLTSVTSAAFSGPLTGNVTGNVSGSAGTVTDANVAYINVANTFTGTQTVQAASTQDSVKIAGRAGGTTSYGVTITPTTLTASRTLTLPNTTGTVITTGDSKTVASGMIADGSITGGTAGSGVQIAATTITNANIAAAAGIVDTKLDLSAATTSGVTPSSAAKIVSASSTASGQSIGATGGFATDKVMDLWADPFAHLRSSECSSMPRLSATSNLGLVSGNAYAARTIYTGGQASHQFSNIRCAVNASGAGVTKFVLFVLDSGGTLVPNGYTIDTLGITGTTMTIGLVSGALNASITLTPGAVYYLGIGTVFTTGMSPKGVSLGTGLSGLVPQMGRSGAYTTGAPASLSSLGSSASIPWVELY